MKANELRVGNWLTSQYDPTPFKVTGHFIHAVEDGMDEYSFEGIPLTPKILKKSGFEFKKGDYYTINNIISLSIDSQIGIYKTWILGDNYGIPNIHYVHQLQNLYFALTGEELNIKL